MIKWWRRLWPKYRVLKVFKEGYYVLYKVQSRELLFLWYDERSFNTKEDAERHIWDLRRESQKPITTVVYTE